MKRYLRSYELELDSPEKGWDKMMLLLEKELPVHTEGRCRNPNISLLIAASIISILLLNTLVLNRSDIFISLEETPLKTAKDISNIVYHNMQKDQLNTLQKSASTSNNRSHSPKRLFPPETSVILSEDAAPALKYAAQTFKHLARNSKSIDKSFRDIAALPPIAQLLPMDSQYFDSSFKLKNNRNNHWQLYAGLAVNSSLGKAQNFRPYPTATLQYNVTEKLFLALGLSVGSPAATRHLGVTNTSLVNDTVNNTRLFQNIKQYQNAFYTDLSLVAGFKLNKKISLQAGLQASILLTTKTKAFTEVYDFEMRLVTQTNNATWQGSTIAPSTAADNNVGLRKIDFRFTSGIRYNLKQASVALNYQHSLQPVLLGEAASKNINNLVSLNMQYKIK